MLLKKISFFIFLFTITGNILSMDITKGKKYKTKDGDIVKIIGSCKEIWKIDGLVEAGTAMNLPGILKYFCDCTEESGNIILLKLLIDKIVVGDKEAIEACLDKKYHGKFYYAKCNSSGQCVHPSWLTPIKDEESSNS